MTIGLIGHREIEEKEAVKEALTAVIEKLITKDEPLEFLFGSVSDFDDICYETVTELKNKYYYIKTNIWRTYVRAEFENIPNWYQKYLEELYEESFFPYEVHNAGKAAYVKRNRVIVDMSDLLLVYYNKDYAPKNRNSGTAIALKYAHSKKKRIINIFTIIHQGE